MNLTHLHLLINHLPIIGSILGGLVLAQGIWNKSELTKIAAYNVLIISSIGAIIAYFTGEAAEETIENIAGVAESTIKTHEDFAIYALIALIALGISSIIGLWATVRQNSYSSIISTITLVITLIGFALIAQTGYLGGQIRHTELNPNFTIPSENVNEEKEE
jgi:uncharacterized membrane protein